MNSQSKLVKKYAQDDLLSAVAAVAVHTAEIDRNYVENKHSPLLLVQFIRLLQKLIHVVVWCKTSNW